MKATLAMLACLSMVGFLSAAEVTGNNTAVVIQKTAVKANGWQFICVPVNSLDITGTNATDNGEGDVIAIETLLPHSLYSAGASVWIVDEYGKSTKVCTNVEDTGWSKEASYNGDLAFVPGTILWLQGDNASDSTVFCGEDRTLTHTARVSGTLIPMKNDSSTAIKLGQILGEGKEPVAGDQVWVLKKDSVNYTIYTYAASIKKPDAPFWQDASGAEVTAAVIAAGEAFYYRAK